MSRPDIFYQPLKGESSGLPHDPFKSFVIPRPIGWISTTSQDGKDNLAPFSQFQNVSFDPPTILLVCSLMVYNFHNSNSSLVLLAIRIYTRRGLETQLWTASRQMSLCGTWRRKDPRDVCSKS
jgi:hypothetical protein